MTQTNFEAVKQVKFMKITDVVNDTEWQQIRKSLIGNWVNNHLHNVQTLRTYFHNNYYNPLAIRRLVNVLTGSVHRTKKTSGQKETDLLRKDVRIRWREMLGENIDENDYRYITGEI